MKKTTISKCSALSILFLALLFPAIWPKAVRAEENENHWVIPKTSAEWLIRLLNPEKFRAGGYKLGSIDIRENRILLEIGKGKRIWKLTLTQAEAADSSGDVAGPFAVSFEKNTPAAMKKALLRGLRKRLASLKTDQVWSRAAWSAEEELGPGAWTASEIRDITTKLLDGNETDLAERAIHLLKRIPESSEFPRLDLRLMAAKGAFGPAETLLDRLKKEKKIEDSEFSWEHARLSILKGDMAGAMKDLKHYREQKSEKQADLCSIDTLANLLILRDEHFRSLELRKAMNENFPECLDIFANRARHQLDIRQDREALQTIENVARAHPEHVALQQALAAALRRNKRQMEAVDIYAKIYNKTGSERMLSLYSTIISQNPDCMPHLEKARKLNAEHPDNLMYKHSLGVLSHYCGFHEDTIRIMDELREKLPTNARVYIYGAMSRYETGDWQGAKEWLDELARIGTADPDLYYCQAVIHHLKDPKLALKHLDEYLRHPQGPDEMPLKRVRSMEIREMLVKGKPVTYWIKNAEGKAKGCRAVPLSFPHGLMLLWLVVGLYFRRKRIGPGR